MSVTESESVAMPKNNEAVEHVAVDDREKGAEEKDTSPPLTFKRCMAFLALTCLLAISTAPLFFITGALCTLSINFADFSIYDC